MPQFPYQKRSIFLGLVLFSKENQPPFFFLSACHAQPILLRTLVENRQTARRPRRVGCLKSFSECDEVGRKKRVDSGKYMEKALFSKRKPVINLSL